MMFKTHTIFNFCLFTYLSISLLRGIKNKFNFSQCQRFFVWRNFATWQEKKGSCKSYKRHFCGKDGPKLPWYEGKKS